MGSTRGIINDNTSGKVYANTDNTTNTSFVVASSSVASGSGISRSLSIELQRAGKNLSVANGAANPITMLASGNITSALFNFRASSLSSNGSASGATTIRLNYQAYGSLTANTINTMIIPSSTASSTNTLSIPFGSGDKFWVDVVSIAPSTPGQGLLMTLNFTRNN